jgi:hypothetical protein
VAVTALREHTCDCLLVQFTCPASNHIPVIMSPPLLRPSYPFFSFFNSESKQPSYTLSILKYSHRASKLSLYGSIALVDLRRLFSFLIYTPTFLNRRALTTIIPGPRLIKKNNLPGRGLTKVKTHCYTPSVRLLGRGISMSPHPSMPQVGFEHMIQVIERVETVHALDRAATVIGRASKLDMIFFKQTE